MKYTAVLLAIVALAAPQISIAAQPSIWFCVWPRNGGSPGRGPLVSDYMQLFTPDAPWKKAARHVSVLKVYSHWFMAASDEELKTQFADLGRRHIALALECGALTAGPDCGNIEGSGGQNLLRIAQRIHENGGVLAYLAMDEPLFFNSIYNGKGGCHVPVAQTVQNAAVNIKAMLAKFPDIQVGDIEPIVAVGSDGLTQAEMIGRYRDGIEAFKAALGRPLAFFDADLDWGSPTVSKDYNSLMRMVRSEGIPVGIIYDGDEGNMSDSSWLETAKHHVEMAESFAGPPDIVVFQSWNHYPKKVLPETDQDAFTSIIDDYFSARTKLSAAYAGKSISGALTTTQGKPIAQAPIDVSIRYRSSTPEPAIYRATGSIPEGADSAIFAIRVNCEGSSGASNISLSNMKLTVAGVDLATRSFAAPADLTTWNGLSHASIQNGSLHIQTDKSISLIVNSAPVSIPAKGYYTLQVKAAIPSASDQSGSFAVIFLSKDKEVTRNVIPFQEPVISLGKVTTKQNGHWSIPLTATGHFEGFDARADYTGDANNWPAHAVIESR